LAPAGHRPGFGYLAHDPLLLVLVAVYLWFWYSFKAEALIDWRCPKLPKPDQLPTPLRELSDESAEGVRRLIPNHRLMGGAGRSRRRRLSGDAIGGDRPGECSVRSLEGLAFDRTYSVVLGITVVLFVASLLRLLLLWKRLRSDPDGSRSIRIQGGPATFERIEWHSIWNPTWSTKREGEKLIFGRFRSSTASMQASSRRQSRNPQNSRSYGRHQIDIRFARRDGSCS